ncbi:MAG: acpS [Clostridiaceae bacterium]|nr:acpS [Clostridiaceae bacterium]
MLRISYLKRGLNLFFLSKKIILNYDVNGGDFLIFGVGVDIVNVSRIKMAIIKHPNFIHKLFSNTEIEYLKSKKYRPEFIAVRFAAKEAVAKAIGTGFRGFSFKDIEINKNLEGKPMVILKEKAHKILQEEGEYKIHLSISHELEMAVAYVIIEI